MTKRRKNSKAEELENVHVGMIMSGAILLVCIGFGVVGWWSAVLFMLALLALVLFISFIISQFPKSHSKEYNELNPVQKTFATASHILEAIGYLSPIG